MFDVTMGSYDGEEICELLGRSIFDSVAKRFDKENVRLYREDGLVLLKNITGRLANRAKKDQIIICEGVTIKTAAHTN